MSIRSTLSLGVLTALLATAGAVSAAEPLTAVKTDTPPKLDGIPDDAAWARAQPLVVRLRDGANFRDGRTTVTMKAAYTADTLYLLLQYDDPTESYRRNPLVKQADGSWKKLVDPDDKGGDNNKYYEDKFAMIWNIGKSIRTFEQKGCDAVCHEGEPGKAYGNKYSAEPDELGDIWHMKAVRGGVSLGQPDDQYVDNTRYDKQKSPEAGRKSDAKTGGGYSDVKLVNGKPEFMPKDAKPANKGGTYWLKDEEKAPFDDTKFAPGDELPSILVARFTGDRGDLAGAGRWVDGKWTYELARKLTTGSRTDVQFDDLKSSYSFGIAAFDNAQVRHAWHRGAMQLRFE